MNRLLFCVIFLLPAFVSGQTYTYKNYNNSDGLASSVVYDICQDTDGFLWFATESGVSRFDGTHFKNFTFDDGLPANVIVKVFADSKGRVWMSGLNKSICYYYKGRIYNLQKDSSFKNLRIKSFVDQFAEDSDGNLLMRAGREYLLYIPAKGAEPMLLPSPLKIGFASVANNFPGKGFLIGNNDSIFRLTGAKMKFWKLGNNVDDETDISLISGLGEWKIPRPNATRSFNSLRGRPRFVNTSDGALELDSVTGHYKERLLPGKAINQTFIDNENNTWFITEGEGVYRLVSKDCKTWSFRQHSPIFSITDWQGDILAGSNYSQLYRFAANKVDSFTFQSTAKKPGKFPGEKYELKGGSNRAYAMGKMKNGDVLIGFDWFVVLLSKGNKMVIRESEPVKSICPIDENTMLVGTARYTAILNCHDLSVVKKIWYDRSTAVHYSGNYYYIATSQGLYAGKHPDSLSFLGNDIPEGSSFILSMITGDKDITWMATQEHGIIGIRDKQLVTHFTMANGLSSNMCKAICLDGGNLWIATDKGLNMINLLDKNYPVKTYTTADGLPFNNIDAVYVRDHVVYIGSPAGLTLFRPEKFGESSVCGLKILDIVLGDSSMPLASSYSVMFNKNNFKINYTAISYRSSENIIYYYRMNGLNNVWDSTNQTTLEFPSLPAGNYKFELMAKNRFGIRSEPVAFFLIVNAPFWQKTWFMISILVIIAAAVCWITIIRFRRLRRKEWEKIRVRQKVNDLEQRVQRAQMNPHFIFNCLNSIQSYILNNDIDATNHYLTEFAQLMRQTLDNSDKRSISIGNEIRYLENYLELEKMRFGQHFNFLIEIDPVMHTNDIYIPVMFLQPYVENSIHHGLRHKKNGQGFIRIWFSQNNKCLVCTIQDNGVGRKRAMEYKSRLGATHISKGTELNRERANTLNEDSAEKMSIETHDLYDEQNEPTGTRVVIKFPFAILEKLNLDDTHVNYR